MRNFFKLVRIIGEKMSLQNLCFNHLVWVLILVSVFWLGGKRVVMGEELGVNPYLKERPNEWVLGNKQMDATISKKSGQILSYRLKKEGEGWKYILTHPLSCWKGGEWENILTHPAGVIVEDRSEGIVYRDWLVSKAKTTINPDSSVTLSLSLTSGDLFSKTSFRMDTASLRWDVELNTTLPVDKEIEIHFNVPCLTNFSHVFFTGAGAPFPVQKVPKQLIYNVDQTLETDKAEEIVIPFVTLLSPPQDLGLSFVSPFEISKPGLTFNFNPTDSVNSFMISNFHLRLRKDKSALAGIYIVPHTGCWRPALAWMVKQYPEYFNLKSQRVLEGEGFYSMIFPDSFLDGKGEEALAGLQKRGVTWMEFHASFPFMGLYAPDRESWDCVYDTNKFSLEAWEKGEVKGMSRCGRQQIADAINLSHKYGIQVYLYFNIIEAWELYAQKYFPQDLCVNERGGNLSSWAVTKILNPDPASPWGKHMIQQLDALIKTYPAIDGVFLDRCNTSYCDFNHDDGISAKNGKPCYMVSFATMKILDVVTKTLHGKGMGIWINYPQTIEMCKDVDGIMVEASGPTARKLQYLGLVRPMICLAHAYTPESIEDEWKTSLACGIFPTAGPYPQKLEERYRPLFSFVKGRKWVLTPHALTLPETLEGNIFQTPDKDYFITVTSPAISQLRPDPFDYNLPVEVKVEDAARIKACYILSADYQGWHTANYTYSPGKGVLKIDIPAHRSASVILLADKEKIPLAMASSPVLFRGGTNQIQLRVSGLKLTGKNRVSISTPWGEKEQEITLKPGEPKVFAWDMEIPAETELGEKEFQISLEGPEGKQKERFTFWVEEMVSLSGCPRAIFTQSPETGEQFNIKIANLTKERRQISMKAEFGDKTGYVEISPADFALESQKSRELVVKIIPLSGKAGRDLKIYLEVGGVRKIERSVMVRVPLVFGKDDLFHDDFKEKMSAKWQIINGERKIEKEGFKGTGVAVVKENLKNYALEVKTKILGSTNPAVPWLKSYLYFRFQDTNNCYRFGLKGDENSIGLWRFQNGQAVGLGGGSSLLVEKDMWYTLRVEVEGGNIKGFVDGKLALEANDGTFSSGGIGLGVVEDSIMTVYKDVIVKKIGVE